MARRPKPKQPKPKPRSLDQAKKQRTEKSNKSKPRNTEQEQKANIKQDLKALIAEKIEHRRIQLHLEKRQVIEALNIGKVTDFFDELESGYLNSSPRKTDKIPGQPYDKPSKYRPRIRIISE